MGMTVAFIQISALLERALVQCEAARTKKLARLELNEEQGTSFHNHRLTFFTIPSVSPFVDIELKYVVSGVL